MGDRYIVIMAGGRGERFWPVSRARRPKHLLPIVGDQPMLRQTLDRLHGLIEAENVFIITSSEQRDAVLEICPDVPEVQVIGEPVGRNTAAAIGLATILIRGRNPDSCFAVLHSDHVIKDKAAFRSDLELAFDVAMRKNALVTLGIHPNYPATGYGYIQAGAAATDFSGDRVFAVNGFVEKPILAVAEEYVASGKYLWNAGMFVWRTSVIARQFARFEPKLWSGLEAIEADLAQRGAGVFDEILADRYPQFAGISIDYAVMEKATDIFTVKASFDWDDVGEWLAVERHFEADEDGNVVRGDSVLEDSNSNIIVSEDGHLTAVVGVDGLIVVQTEDATLICPKDRAQEIKRVVERIKERPDGGRFL